MPNQRISSTCMSGFVVFQQQMRVDKKSSYFQQAEVSMLESVEILAICDWAARMKMLMSICS
jgi:hypothetical protein